MSLFIYREKPENMICSCLREKSNMCRREINHSQIGLFVSIRVEEKLKRKIVRGCVLQSTELIKILKQLISFQRKLTTKLNKNPTITNGYQNQRIYDMSNNKGLEDEEK